MKKLIDNLDRIDLFNHYNDETNPFLFVTSRIDITNLYNNCNHYYPTIAYFLHKALLKIDNYKYRFEDHKIYYYDDLRLNFTEKKNDGNIGYFDVKYSDNYKDFIEDFLNKKERLLNGENVDINNDHGEVWYSCVPWFNFTQVLTPFDKLVTIPQMLWDKFTFENDKVYVNLTIMAHHGFVDGFHIGKLLSNFEELMNNISDYI